MKRSAFARFLLTFVLVFAMLSPAAALGLGDGKKHFKEGMKYEATEQWDKAAEAFALAVTDSPKNPEYRLHLQRSLFNASQMYMKIGNTAANEKDYQGAYIAFRKAFAFDPVNELAKSEMARMVRLQEEVNKGNNPDATATSDGKVKLVPTSYSPATANPPVPQRIETLRDVPFPGGVDLQYIVKELAKELDLNVLFDADSRLETRKIRIELKQVSAAKALDYIFLQENLFFQKVGPRTILVATGLRRSNFQQLVLRTFYLANASPKDIKAVIAAAIPPQPGRSQTIVLEDTATNSITVRDTEENVRLIGKLISSLDKDRAEVVMDVAIYEVNKNDLLQFGNQLGTGGANGTLLNLGGFGGPLVRGGNSSGNVITGMPFKGLDFASIALGLPISSFAALQEKNNTKLIASTQIHAFNNEDSTARIGQRVPVKTATFNTGGTVNNGGVVSDVINYEQVGLTLKFKPIVFPNQDVQVGMEIESKDVTGAASLTPIFTERKITGTARIQNNKTLLLASVAQGVESNGRTGLPLLGLIPIIGRLFTAPTKDNRQVDIVIAITPRVIRAPAILPEDEIERPTGALGVPTSGSLEAMIQQEDRDELLAAARRVPNTAAVQLPDQPADAPTYIRTSTSENKTATPPSVTADANAAAKQQSEALNLKPIDTSAKTLDLFKTSEKVTPEVSPLDAGNGPVAAAESRPVAALQISGLPETMTAGQKVRIAVNASSTAAFRMAVLGLTFDDKKLAVRNVSFGDVFGPQSANKQATPFLNQNGKMFVSLAMPEGISGTTGALAYIEIEALADGKPEIALAKDVLSFLDGEGKNFAVKF